MFIAITLFTALVVANMYWADWEKRQKTETMRDKWERINRKNK